MSYPTTYFHPDDNIASLSTVTAGTGTEDTAYPLTNATDLSYANLANPSKLNETSGAWVGDQGSAREIVAAVIWHNFDPALACAFQMNSTNSWASPSFTTALTIGNRRADNYTVKVFVDLGSVTLRYWRLVVTGTNSVPIGMKILLFTRRRTLARGILWGFTVREHQTNVDMTTDALVPWAYDLGAAPRQLSARMTSTDADQIALREWFRACGGRAKVTCLMPWVDGYLNGADPWLVRWSSGPVAPVSPTLTVAALDATRHYPNAHPMTVQWDEITAGDPEWY